MSRPADLDGLRSLHVSNLIIPLVFTTMFLIPGVVFRRNGTELRSSCDQLFWNWALSASTVSWSLSTVVPAGVLKGGISWLSFL